MIRDIRDQLNGRISWRKTFTALRYPNYRLWFWGQMTSLFGTWMQMTALAYLTFEMTHSPTYLGYVGFANGVPTWLFMLYAGVVADRMSKRQLMIITQSAMMILAFILAGLTFLHIIQPWQIIILSFLSGVTNAFDAPARQAIVQDLVPYEDMTNAIALNATMFNAATALSPALGGLTYALFGPGWCFTINGLSFLAIIAALAVMKIAPAAVKTEHNSILADLKEGLRYVANHSMIRTIISLIGVISLFGLSFATLVPAWAVKILGGNAATNGILLSARGLGALIGALLIASLGRFQFRGKLMTFGSFAFPALLFIFSLMRWVPLSLVFLFGLGFAQILILNLANASVQTLTPRELRGRVMGIYTFTFFGLMPIGALFIGGMAGRFSEPAAIWINVVIIAIFSGLIWMFVPKLRRLQ